MQTLRELSNHIATVWKCDPARYPELATMTAQERKNFLLKHSILHITKTAGRIAAICEDFDHNRQAKREDTDALKILAIKMFINSLKLAEEAGVTAEELVREAPAYIK